MLRILALLAGSLAGCAAISDRGDFSNRVAPFTFEWREGPLILSGRVKITDHQAVCILPVQDAKGMTTNYRA